MTYRLGHHSTSDDSTAYRQVILFFLSISIFRTAEEVQTWGDKDHPITRFKRYITEQGWWNDEQEKEWQKDVRKRVLTAFNQAEKEKLSHYHDLFEGVYKYVFFLHFDF